jgi:hypothetical protein
VAEGPVATTLVSAAGVVLPLAAVIPPTDGEVGLEADVAVGLKVVSHELLIVSHICKSASAGSDASNPMVCQLLVLGSKGDSPPNMTI